MGLYGSPPKNEHHDRDGLVKIFNNNLSRRWMRGNTNPSDLDIFCEHKVAAMPASTGCTIQDLQEIHALSLKWKPIIPETCPTSRGIIREHMATIFQRPPGPYAIYIVWRMEGRSWILVPHHRDLVMGRPDLYYVKMTSRSRDLLNAGAVHVKNYRVGDAIAVTTLQRRYNARDEDFCTSNADMTDVDKNKFWMVGDFYLIQRHIIDHCLITKISRRLTDSFNHACIADGLNVPVYLDHQVLEKCSENKIILKSGQIFYGKLFVPVLQPGSFLSDAKKSEKAQEISKADVYSPIIHFYPIVTEIEEIPEDFREELYKASSILESSGVENPNLPRILFNSGHFGLSGLLTMENKNRDLAFYPTKIQDVVVKCVKKKEKYTTVEFELNNGSGSPSWSQWEELTKFSMNFKESIYEMIVESSTYSADSSRLEITARSESQNFEDLRVIQNLKDKNVVIFQSVLNNLHHLRNFPDSKTFEEIQWDSNFGKCWAALLGGPRIDIDVENSKSFHEQSLFSHLYTKLTQEQAAYANAMLDGSASAIAVDSCFRSGKTRTIAVTANLLAIKDLDIDSDEVPKVHIASATTNLATTYLVRAHLALKKPVKAVRIISNKGYYDASAQMRSSIDFPKLWPRILKEHVLYDAEENDDVMQSAVHHLGKKKHLTAWDLEDPELTECFEKSFKPPLGLFKTFMRIYKPQIIFGTVSALIEGFGSDFLKCITDKISTVQFDNAHQLPMYALVSFGTWIPNARYAFLGDPNQLDPYSGRLTQVLNSFANGAIISTGLRKFPKFEFRTVFKTSPFLVNICSDSFYGRRLFSDKTVESSKNQKLLPFPLQVLDLHSPHKEVHGKSLENKDEAFLAVKLVKEIQNRMPNASIGILCFYKAQSGRVSKFGGLKQVFVGTVDASQDHNFDIVVSLTTRCWSFGKSDLLDNTKRVNVAISRAKIGCFLLVNRHMAEDSSTWNRILHEIPRKHFHYAKEFVEELQAGYGWGDQWKQSCDSLDQNVNGWAENRDPWDEEDEGYNHLRQYRGGWGC